MKMCSLFILDGDNDPILVDVSMVSDDHPFGEQEHENGFKYLHVEGNLEKVEKIS